MVQGQAARIALLEAHLDATAKLLEARKAINIALQASIYTANLFDQQAKRQTRGR